MKLLHFLILFLVFFSCTNFRNEKNDRKNIKEIGSTLDSVVTYIYDGAMGQPIVTKSLLLDSTVVSSKKLSHEKIIELQKIIKGEIQSYPDSICNEVARCFSPLHGIVFYESGKPVNWMSICFTCNQIGSSFKINTCPAQLIDFFIKLHLKIGDIDNVPSMYTIPDDYEIITTINERKYGKDYVFKRHNIK